MIAKAKVISHGANAIRYSVDKDKAEIVKTNLLPDDISPTAMWARMLALQKKFEDKLNRYHPLKRNMIRIEVSQPRRKRKVGRWRNGRGWRMTLSVSLMRLTFQPSRSARVQRQPTSKTANMLLRFIVTARVALCTFILMRTA